MISVLDKLASALNRRDEVPNQELAREIVRANDEEAVSVLMENVANKNRNIQSDCIKVLYEIGAVNAELIAPYYREFGKLLGSNQNRLVWGAMIALDAIATVEPKGIYALLPKIMEVADRGSVITRDHAVGILIKLGALKQYADKCVPLLIQQLMSCPPNQFAMYAERSLPLANNVNRAALERVLTKRLEALEKESQRSRVTKVLKRLEKLTS